MRFPEFSGEWEKCKLGEICKFFSGGTPSTSNKEYYNGDIPFIRSGEIHFGFTELKISKEGLNNSSAKIIKKGDLLLALYGATSGDIAISKIEGAINQAILCIRTKYDKVFLKSAWEKHSNKILKAYLQGGQGNLSADIIKKIKFSFPLIDEQIKLSTFISLIDERIQTQKKIIEDLKKLKSEISKRILLNIKGKEYNLGAISKIYQPQTISTSDLSSNGTYPVYGANGIIGNYHLYNHEKEQICITCRGSNCGIVNYTEAYSWITGNSMVINTDNVEIIDKRYLYHYLSFLNFKPLISGSGQPQIVRAPLAKLLIILPPKNIQLKIAVIIDSYMKKIDTEIEILDLFLLQKKSILSQMFI